MVHVISDGVGVLSGGLLRKTVQKVCIFANVGSLFFQMSNITFNVTYFFHYFSFLHSRLFHSLHFFKRN